MIETTAGWLIQQPVHITLVALFHYAVWAIGRATVLRRVPEANALWVPGALWLA